MESWEDIADNGDEQQPPSSSVRGTRDTEKPSPLPQPQPQVSTEPAKTLKGIEGVESTSKKHPSPNLSDRPTSSSSSGKGTAKQVLPPKKREDEKENINIVFIGHVGESCRDYCCLHVPTTVYNSCNFRLAFLPDHNNMYILLSLSCILGGCSAVISYKCKNGCVNTTMLF